MSAVTEEMQEALNMDQREGSPFVPACKRLEPPAGRFVPPPVETRLPDYQRMWQRLREHLSIPSPDQLYRPLPAMEGPHPRFLLAGNADVQTLRARLKMPAMAQTRRDVLEAAADWSAQVLPASQRMEVEDPLRGIGDRLMPMALACLIEEEPSQRRHFINAVQTQVLTMVSWGLPKLDLPVSHFMLGIATVYDWLQDELPQSTLQSMRKYLVDLARWMRSDTNNSAWEWRGQEEWMANHKWFNYAALAMAAVVLWGETDAPLERGETKLWMDEAMEVFHVVQKTLGVDGAPLEGFLYQSYGNGPYFAFACIADQLTQCATPMLDTPGLRLQGLARLHCKLPGNAGFLSWADAYPKVCSGAPYLRCVASRFKDGYSQLAANLLDAQVKRLEALNAAKGTSTAKRRNDWRNAFWYDSSVPPARLETLELHHDFQDLGLHVARSSWSEDATFFAIKCGHVSGTTVGKIWGKTLTSGHTQPDEGMVQFYCGEQAILPAANYAFLKLTSNHALTVVEGRAAQDGFFVGQVGEGLRWFGGDQTLVRQDARVLSIEHAAAYHSYLCDLGGLYALADERVDDGVIYPRYLRRVVYFPAGVVVIADRLEVEVPRSFQFRLPTLAQRLEVTTQGFVGEVGEVPLKILDFSPREYQRGVVTETLCSFRDAMADSPERLTAVLRAQSVRRAQFVVALGVRGAETGIEISGDDEEVVIEGIAGDPLRFGWD